MPLVLGLVWTAAAELEGVALATVTATARAPSTGLLAGSVA
jgi:hypothetical protein